MSTYIGVIFPDEAKAGEGSRVLKDLHAGAASRFLRWSSW